MTGPARMVGPQEWTERGRGERTITYRHPDYPGVTVTYIRTDGSWTVSHLEGRSRTTWTAAEAIDVAALYVQEHTHHFRPTGPAAERYLVCVCGETPVSAARMRREDGAR